MQATCKKTLKDGLRGESGFAVVAELSCGPGFNFEPVSKFMTSYLESCGAGIPGGFNFVGVSLPQSPGGAANMAPADVLSLLRREDLLGDLDFIPHITCKDFNADAIAASLVGFRSFGIESVLTLTGDKPVGAKGVFELDAVGLLGLVGQMNNESWIKAKSGKWDNAHQFYSGAAVSPFKYTEASQMQQYFKMEKKIRAGAKFLITQVGWDWKKSLELMRYLKDSKLDVPVIGNVYLLSTLTAAPRLMHDNELPGCFVSDGLYEKVCSESVDEHINRAAQQVAMYKAIGAAGVDIGGVSDYKIFLEILNRAAKIGDGWEKYKDNLCWPAKKAFYLYGSDGRRASLSNSPKKLKQRFFNFMHRAILDADYRGFHIFKGVMGALGGRKDKGFVYTTFNAGEKAFKYIMFSCQECGDCFLPENFGICTLGDCEKGMQNAPCGDSTAEGYCGNNLDRVCVGELIYNAAAAEKGGLERLRATINKARNPALEHTSSILNYLFGKDHTMKNPLINIGESIHASIPKTGQVMRELQSLGADAYSKESGPLNYIKALVESQADDGADYIAVNLDAFGESDVNLAVKMMPEYVKLVKKWGKGVPICLDSSNDDVLIAGLKEWYNTDQKVKQPLLNSIKVHTMDKMLPYKKQYDYAFIGLLVSEEKAEGPGGFHTVEQLYSMAKRIFEKAAGEYGFRPEEIFFDTTVFPLAIDMPMMPGVPSYTYRAFETIKKIKTDPKMKGVHCSLGISNCVRDLPGRKIGVCRAYVAKAMEYGLDAGIVNAAHHYGLSEPDAEIVKLVDAYATMDGSNEKMTEAMTLMSKFCQESRKKSV